MAAGDKPDIYYPMPEGYEPSQELPAHEHKDYRWCMVVDLDRCIGCSACVVGCYAENNVAVVGEGAGAQGARNVMDPGPAIFRRRTNGRRVAGDALPALRQRPVRVGLPRLLPHHSERGPEQPGLQPLLRDSILLPERPLQGAALQLVYLRDPSRSNGSSIPM